MPTLDSAYAFHVINELEALNRRYPCPVITATISYIKALQQTRMEDALRINELEAKLREYEAREATLRG
jgi:hypothetical protein